MVRPMPKLPDPSPVEMLSKFRETLEQDHLVSCDGRLLHWLRRNSSVLESRATVLYPPAEEYDTRLRYAAEFDSFLAAGRPSANHSMA